MCSLTVSVQQLGNYPILLFLSFFILFCIQVKGKVFYGQEFPKGESTTTVCWEQLAISCSNAAEVVQ